MTVTLSCVYLFVQLSHDKDHTVTTFLDGRIKRVNLPPPKHGTHPNGQHINGEGEKGKKNNGEGSAETNRWP